MASSEEAVVHSCTLDAAVGKDSVRQGLRLILDHLVIAVTQAVQRGKYVGRQTMASASGHQFTFANDLTYSLGNTQVLPVRQKLTKLALRKESAMNTRRAKSV